jgi:hypothetical protein
LTRSLGCYRREKIFHSVVWQNPLVKFSPGVVHFYPASDFNMLKINNLIVASRLHFSTPVGESEPRIPLGD